MPDPNNSNDASHNLPSEDREDPVCYDVIIIGGGVVGLSILRHATLAGYNACVVEREPCLAHWASGSNSGIVCTGVDAPPHSLERALIRESISTIRTHCRVLTVPVRECGSLVCSWRPASTTEPDGSSTGTTAAAATGGDNDQQGSLDEVLQQSHSAGDTHARRFTRNEVLMLEPHLSHQIDEAVHIPGEVVVDPWLYTISLATHALENGATIHVNFDVDLERSALDDDNGIWTLVNRRHTTSSDGNSDVDTTERAPASVRGRSVVNATGIWSDQVETKLAGGCKWSAKPRRGQYLVLSAPTTDGCWLTRPIQPVPTLRTKGLFVFSSIYHQIVVGPTATEQSSRDDRAVDPLVRHELLEVANRVLPSLDTSHPRIVGEYVGIRPATDHRDYQIHLQSRRRWVACAGIRSTGLTASLGIGRHVVHLLQQEVLPVTTPLWERGTICTSPLPPLVELIREFQERNDGKVTIHGREYTVTHPLTVFGWRQGGTTTPRQALESLTVGGNYHFG